MKKVIKYIFFVISLLFLLFVMDLICIFIIKRPLFGIRVDNGDSVNIVYKGLLYDTYNCNEYAIPQIKAKGTKFLCAVEITNIGEIKEIVDTTKKIKDFMCAEALESFYEDENYIYYWSCIKDKYMIVRYKSGYEESISEALKYGTITITDLDNFNIDYIKEEK